MINRQTKNVLESSDSSYIEQNAHYLPYRAVLNENLKQQVSCRPNSARPCSQASQENVRAIKAKLQAAKPFSTSEDLSNIFTGKTATHEETRGMLNCHSIGHQKLSTLFESRVMRLPSIGVPVRQEKLRTMSAAKKKKLARPAKPHNLMVLSFKAQLL